MARCTKKQWAVVAEWTADDRVYSELLFGGFTSEQEATEYATTAQQFITSGYTCRVILSSALPFSQLV